MDLQFRIKMDTQYKNKPFRLHLTNLNFQPDMAACELISSGDDGTVLSPDVVVATFKILVLGNADVGKSSLIRLYTTGKAARDLLPTIGR